MAENISPTPISPFLKDTSSLYSEVAEFPVNSGEDTSDRLLKNRSLPMSSVLNDSSNLAGESILDDSSMNAFFTSKSPLRPKNNGFRPPARMKNNVRYSTAFHSSTEDNSVSDVSIGNCNLSLRKNTRVTSTFNLRGQKNREQNYIDVSLEEDKTDTSSTQVSPEDERSINKASNFNSRKRKTRANFQDFSLDDETTTQIFTNASFEERSSKKRMTKKSGKMTSVGGFHGALMDSTSSETSFDDMLQNASPPKFGRKSQRRQTELTTSDALSSSLSSANLSVEGAPKRFKSNLPNAEKETNKFYDLYSESWASDVTTSLIETADHIVKNLVNERKGAIEEEEVVRISTAEHKLPSPCQEKSSNGSTKRNPSQSKNLDSSSVSNLGIFEVGNHESPHPGNDSTEKSSQELAMRPRCSGKQLAKQISHSAVVSEFNSLGVEESSLFDAEERENSTMSTSDRNLKSMHNFSGWDRSQQSAVKPNSNSRQFTKEAKQSAEVSESSVSTEGQNTSFEGKNLVKSNSGATSRNLISKHSSSASNKSQESAVRSSSSSKLSAKQVNQFAVVLKSNMANVEAGSFFEGDSFEKSATRASIRNLCPANLSTDAFQPNIRTDRNEKLEKLVEKSSQRGIRSSISSSDQNNTLGNEQSEKLNMGVSHTNSSLNCTTDKAFDGRSIENNNESVVLKLRDQKSRHSSSLKSKFTAKEQLDYVCIENPNKAQMTQKLRNTSYSLEHPRGNVSCTDSGNPGDHEDANSLKNQVPLNISTATSHSDTLCENPPSEQVSFDVMSMDDKSSTNSVPGIFFHDKINFRRFTFNSENELVLKMNESLKSPNKVALPEVESNDDEEEESIFSESTLVNHNDLPSPNGSLSSYSVSKFCSNKTFVKDDGDGSRKIRTSKSSKSLSCGNEVNLGQKLSTKKCEVDSGSSSTTPDYSIAADGSMLTSMYASNRLGSSFRQFSGSERSISTLFRVTTNVSKINETHPKDNTTELDYGNFSDLPNVTSSVEKMRLHISDDAPVCNLNLTNFESSVIDENIHSRKSLVRGENRFENSKNQQKNRHNYGHSSTIQTIEEEPKSFEQSNRNSSLMEDTKGEEDAVSVDCTGQSGISDTVDGDGETPVDAEAPLNKGNQTRLSRMSEVITDSEYFSSDNSSFNVTAGQKTRATGTVPSANIDEYFAKPLYPVNRRVKSVQKSRSSTDSTTSNSSLSILSKCIGTGKNKKEKINAPKTNQQPLYNMNLRKRDRNFPKFITPKVSRPAYWVTNKLYSFLEEKLKPQHKIDARRAAEEFINFLQEKCKKLVKEVDEESENELISVIKHQMIELHIVNSEFMFFHFCFEFLPIELQDKIVPCMIPFSEKCSKPNFNPDTLFDKHF